MNNFVMKHMKACRSFGGDLAGGLGGGSAGKSLGSLRKELKKEKELTSNQNLIILKIIGMLSYLGDTNEDVNTALISKVF